MTKRNIFAAIVLGMLLFTMAVYSQVMPTRHESVSNSTLGQELVSKPCRLYTTTDKDSQTNFLFLDCGCGPTPIVHPNSLMGHVTIKNATQALQYVRLFSLPQNWNLFLGLGHMVEVQVSSDSNASVFSVPNQDLFTSNGLFAPRVSNCEIGLKRGFLVERVVVKPDQKIYAVSEFVRGDGFYQVLTERVLLEDATKAGVMFLGDA